MHKSTTHLDYSVALYEEEKAVTTSLLNNRITFSSFILNWPITFIGKDGLCPEGKS